MTLLTTAGGVSLVLTAAFAWFTRPEAKATVEINRPPTTFQPALPRAIGVVLPDRGEPRTERLANVEALIQGLRQNPVKTGSLADALLTFAQVSIHLERYAQAQQAIDEVLQLVQDSEAWQRREAGLISQTIRLLDSGDGLRKQQLRDIAGHHVEALRLHAGGHFLAAVGEAREAVALQRRFEASGGPATTRSDQDARLADELLLLGRLAVEHSDTYGEAGSILREARERCLRSRSEIHPTYAEILTSLALLDEDKGNFDAADALYERALQVQREARGELSLDFARTLAWQGRMHLDWWEEYAAGKGYRALQIREQMLGQDHLECADSLEHLGMNAVWLLNFDKAEMLLRRALKIRTQYQGPNHPDLAESLNWLSQVYVYRGDVAQASLALGQAMELTRRGRGPTHPRLVRYLPSMARIGKFDWNPSRGEREGRRAIDIAEVWGMTSHPMALDARTAISELLLEEESPYGVAQLLRRNPRYIAEFIRQMISAHTLTQRHAQLPSYAAARIQLANSAYWDDYLSVTRAEASQLLDEALENMKRYGHDLHPLYAEYLLVRGRWHLWNSEHEEAAKYLTESRDVLERQYGLVSSEIRGGSWRALAGLYMHQGVHSAEAAECLRITAQLDEDIFRKNAAGQCDIDRFSMARARFFSLGCCVLNSLIAMPDEIRYRQILVAKGETSQFQLNERLLHERPEFAAGLTKVSDARHHLKTMAFDIPTDSAQYPQWREAMFDAADAKESLERQVAIALRGVVPEIPSPDPKTVQEHLPSNGVLLDFIQFTDLGPPPKGHGRLNRVRTMGVFILSHSEPARFIRLGSTAEIEGALVEWLTAMQSEDSDRLQLRTLADRVSSLVWEPIRELIQYRELVLIAPDGPVCFLPFAALPGRLPDTYLLEDVTIGYVPSARQWVELLERKVETAGTSLLAVGDVDYRTSLSATPITAMAGRRGLLPDDARWENLPATKAEAESIAALFEKSGGSANETRLLAGGTLTVEELHQALEKHPRFFHFAGHGLFADWQATPEQTVASFDQIDSAYATNSESIVLGRAPLLLSGLVLSPPPRSQHPGDSIMTAEEVASLDLRGLEMVVLSACETGLGKTAGGEGVMGLQRAFLNAGARSAVTSLWKVDDAATSLLMERFYHHLWIEKLPKWQALRQSQIDLLNHPGQVQDRKTQLVSRGIKTGRTKAVSESPIVESASVSRAHPGHWGAFVLYGDGR